MNRKEFERQIDNSWDFRDANTKEYTHCYHTYPAMMIPQVARTLIEKFRPEGKCNLLFDPYCGSGTSLVEASLQGIASLGTDLNPLARLMSRVKTRHYDVSRIKEVFSSIQSSLIFYDASNVVDRNFDRISNSAYWYSEDSLLRLSYLSQLIRPFSDVADFFNVALSEVVREVSFTRNGEFKRFRMQEEKIQTFHPDVFRLFEEKVVRNLKGLVAYNELLNTASAQVCDFNTTEGVPLHLLNRESVDMVVTSPPYGDSKTTVAYGQFSRWANEWFGFEHAQNLDNLLMGGKKCSVEEFSTTSILHELNQIRSLDEKRYFEVVSFLNDYWKSIQNVASVVRKGGVVCYVVGNRTVKGIQISLDYFTAEMFEKMGLVHEVTIVREIPNKRMPSKTSPTNKTGLKVNTMSNEYMVIMHKK